MGKKFAEYSQFDLSKVNAEVLKKWDENQMCIRDRLYANRYPVFPELPLGASQVLLLVKL